MDDADIQALVADDFVALADLLEPLPAEQWDTPSLCEDWRVREVVAHMTMPARYGEESFMAELAECGFDFTLLSNTVASRDAQLPTDELVANLRDQVLHQWMPPGGGAHGALNHVVIHGLDVTIPLRVPRRSPDATIRLVLDDLTAGGGHAHFDTDISGRAFAATDLDWSYGSGPTMRGPAEDIAAFLCGRTVPVRR
jgi:uncharacterized protein (TIGR03083 family)